MELSKRTINILKTFSSVNEGLVFKPGNSLRTISSDQGIFIEAEIDEKIPSQFAIADLALFLRNIEAADKTEIELTDKAAILTSSYSRVKYGYGSEKIIKQPPDKSLDDALSRSVADFTVTKDQLSRIVRFIEINNLKSVTVGSDGSKIYMSASDDQNPDSVNVRLDIGNVADDDTQVWQEKLEFDRLSKLPAGSDFNVKVVPKAFIAFFGDRTSFFMAVIPQ
jgi:hypothetical protein